MLLRGDLTALALLLGAACGACALDSQAMQQKKAEFQRTIPTCEATIDCNAKWEAAQLWIIHHAGFKLQTVTDVILETYNPGPYDALDAVRVTKEPIGGGRYALVVYVWCNNIFSCVPNTWDAAIDFNRTINGVQVSR